MMDSSPYLNLHVPPDEMVKYIQDLMKLPHGEIAAGTAMMLAQRHWGGDTPLARAALLRWSALNLAFQDKRLRRWWLRPALRLYCSTTSGRYSTFRRCSMPPWIFSRRQARPKRSHEHRCQPCA
jgi:hypothetical protein